MKPAFLSHELSPSTPAYGNGPAFEVVSRREIGRDSQSRSQVWKLGNHMGTHMDFPAHFVKAGKTVSDFSADAFIFKKITLVTLWVRPGRLILPQDINWPSNISSRDLILFKTGFEKRRGRNSYVVNGPGFHPETCQEILKRAPKARAIGFDFISLTSYQHRETGREAHRVLLGSKQAPFIIEDMHLAGLNRPPKTVMVSPLRVLNADGAPVTVIANF